MGVCNANSPAGVSLISDRGPPPRRSIQPFSAIRLIVPWPTGTGSLDTDPPISGAQILHELGLNRVNA